jgi:hypothetical protein
MKKKIAIIGIIVIGIIAGLFSYSKQIIYNTIINTVKNGCFSEIPEDITIGELMNTLCSDSKWEYTPDTETGAAFVTYTGRMKGQPVEMLFFITNFAGEIGFRLNSFSLNGIYASSTNYITTGVTELDMVPEVLYEAYCTVKNRSR